MTNTSPERPAAQAPAWWVQAMARRRAGDLAGAGAVLDEALKREPRNLRALMARGDVYADTGDGRAAASFYTAVVRLAGSSQLPPDLTSEVRRAQGALQRYADDYASHLVEGLTAKGYDPSASSARFTRSLDIMTGKRQVYHQQPLVYYFPELPQIQFYDAADFPWVPKVEAATGPILTELQALMADEAAFAPYVTHVPNRAQKSQHGMLENQDWSSCFLMKEGKLVPEFAERCPRTLAAIRDLPQPAIEGRGPTIMFSMLRPGARIPAHHGFVNTRLICHLPLIVPPGCGFRVGNETREWVEGEVMVFDDTIEHEAWNNSERTRVILLFDVWRPELTEEERGLIAAMFAAIDASGRGREWTA